jgi:8-oxo-dGTP pyrophosphatase MutT (NUDIX family)
MTDKNFDLKDFDKGVFLVATLGVVFDPSTKKFLIARREDDAYFEKLKWCFPGGRPDYGKDLEESFEDLTTERTGLKIKSLGPIFSRLFKENEKILLIYYLCESISGELKPNKKFKEFKWVSPDELESYFTTSFDPRLKEFIMNLR